MLHLVKRKGLIGLKCREKKKFVEREVDIMCIEQIYSYKVYQALMKCIEKCDKMYKREKNAVKMVLKA